MVCWVVFMGIGGEREVVVDGGKCWVGRRGTLVWREAMGLVIRGGGRWWHSVARVWVWKVEV